MGPLALLLALCLTGCSGDEPKTDAPPTTDTATAVDECPTDSIATWDAFVRPWLTTWCTPCHSAAIQEEWRLGAPVGVDFDTWEDVLAWQEVIVAVAGDDESSMPPAGGVTPEERALLREWVSCGSPGPESVPDACEERIEIFGDRRDASAADAEALCDEGNHLAGTLTIAGSVELGCLCGVDGGLEVSGEAPTEVLLPSLSTVGGLLSVLDSPQLTRLSLPKLESAGALDLRRIPALTELTLVRLTLVTGDVVVLESGLAGTLAPPRLATIGRSLLIEDNPQLVAFAPPRLETVGGSYEVRANTELVRLDFTNTLRVLGGDLRIEDNPALEGLVGFRYLGTLGGDIVFRDNASLTTIDGFNELVSLDGSLSVTGNTSLLELHGLHKVSSTEGGVTVSNNPSLVRVDTLNQVQHIDGSVVIESNELSTLPGFAVLESVDGDFSIQRNAGLTAINGLTSLVDVGGDLVVSDNDALMAMRLQVATVGGDLEITLNDALVAIDGGDTLREVGGLQVRSNPLLTTIDGLYGLTGVAGDAVLAENDSLASLPGLATLQTVEGSLELERNDALTNIDGLEQTRRIGRDLRILSNEALGDDTAWALVDVIGEDKVEGLIVIDDND